MSLQTGDARFSTSNTNLAACLGALRIPVKSEQPITIVKDENGTKLISFWFEGEGAEEFCGAFHKAIELDKCWRNRDQFDREHPNHPLIPMRTALDKRDWLTKAWHGRIMPAASLDKAGFTTRDTFFAAILMASGYPLLRLDKPSYVFRKIRKTDIDRIQQEFDSYDHPDFENRPVSLMRRALEVRKILVGLARHPDLETSLRFTDGIVDAASGRVAFISEKASDEQISKTLDVLTTI